MFQKKILELYLANLLPLERVFINCNRNTYSMYSIFINPSPHPTYCKLSTVVSYHVSIHLTMDKLDIGKPDFIM